MKSDSVVEDEVLLRMLKTPPKPHAQMKVGKVRKAKGAKRKARKKASGK